MDLTTNYMGLRLPHPLMVGASPLVRDLDVVKRIEDAGAAAWGRTAGMRPVARRDCATEEMGMGEGP